jgi:hypothetical protein
VAKLNLPGVGAPDPREYDDQEELGFNSEKINDLREAVLLSSARTWAYSLLADPTAVCAACHHILFLRSTLDQT